MSLDPPDVGPRMRNGLVEPCEDVSFVGQLLERTDGSEHSEVLWPRTFDEDGDRTRLQLLDDFG